MQTVTLIYGWELGEMLASLGTALAAEFFGTMTAAIYPDASRSTQVLRNHALPRIVPPQGQRVISVHDTIFLYCVQELEQTLVQREPVNFILGQQN